MLCKVGLVKTRLSACGLGLALGIAEGLCLLLFAWSGWLWGYGDISIHHQLASVFIGYAPTLIGGLIGFVWGFIKGFIFGFIIAVIYNCCCCCRKHCAPKDEVDIKNP